MASATNRPATIHYRRLTDDMAAFNGTTLEAAMRKALLTKPHGKSLSLKDDFHLRLLSRTREEDCLFMNESQDGKADLWGDLVHFTQGHMQPLFKENKKPAPKVAIQQMKADDGEFIHSLLYWYVRGNHVFVLQARTARTADFEQYLSWLLTDASGSMTKPLHVILQTKFDPAKVGGDLKDVEEISIGGTLASSSAALPEEGKKRIVAEQHTLKDLEKAASRSMVMDVLKAVISDPAVVDDFVEKISPTTLLKLRVTIGMTSLKEKIDKVPLKSLEVGLRNLPDAEVSVKSKGGKATPLGELQLSYPTKISVKHSLWEPESVLLAFNRAYTEFVESGRIDATAVN